jgi:membrane protease subunit HflK
MPDDALTPQSEGAPETAGPELGARPAERALAAALRTVFAGLRVVMVIVLVALLFSNTRFVQQNQQAVILRFGKVVGTGAGRVRQPGLVFAWPRPIDEIIVVDADRIQSLKIDDFMYRKEARGDSGQALGDTLDPALDGYTLTGDANIIHSAWEVRYKIKDVVLYALNVADPEDLIRRTLAASVVQACTKFSVEEALWADILGLREEIRRELQARLDEAESGILGDTVTPSSLEPPRQQLVRDAFVEVTNAGQLASQEMQKAIRYRDAQLAAAAGDRAPALAAKLAELAEAEEAPEGERDEAKIATLREEAAGLLDAAGGRVARILGEARTYHTRVVEAARSMAETFDALNEKFHENPDVFVRQTYQNAMERVLAKVGVKFVLYPRDREWWIKVEPQKKKPVKEEPPVGAPTPEERQRRGPFGTGG